MALIGTMDCGVSALNAFEQGLQVIGNNIANVNTTGFKGSSTQYGNSFSDILQGTGATSTIEVGMGANVMAINQNFSQGQLSSTGVSTDVAVSGNGFFQVEDPSSGAQYVTRDGEFSFNSSGNLVNAEGYEVMGLTGGSATSTPAGTYGPIKLGTPPTNTQLQSVSIDNSGNVTETYSDGSTAVTNQLLLMNFTNPNALQSAGNNLYTNQAAAGPVGGSSTTMSASVNAPGSDGLGNIQAGYLEGSNVDLTQQFSDLITTQRSFEAASRLITVSDTVLDDIVNLKRS